MFTRTLTDTECQMIEAEVARHESDHAPVRRDGRVGDDHVTCYRCNRRSMAFGSRVAQGLPMVVTDPGALARISAIFDAPPADLADAVQRHPAGAS